MTIARGGTIDLSRGHPFVVLQITTNIIFAHDKQRVGGAYSCVPECRECAMQIRIGEFVQVIAGYSYAVDYCDIGRRLMEWRGRRFGGNRELRVRISGRPFFQFPGWAFIQQTLKEFAIKCPASDRITREEEYQFVLSSLENKTKIRRWLVFHAKLVQTLPPVLLGIECAY